MAPVNCSPWYAIHRPLRADYCTPPRRVSVPPFEANHPSCLRGNRPYGNTSPPTTSKAVNMDTSAPSLNTGTVHWLSI